MKTIKTTLISGPWLGLVFLVAAPAFEAEAQTGLTIYQDGRVLMRRTVPVRVPAGLSAHRLALGPVEPGTVFTLDPGVLLVGAAYDASVDEASALGRAVGRRIAFAVAWRGSGVVSDTIVAEVVGVDPPRYRLPGGRITYVAPGVPLFPEELIQTEPTLQLRVRATEPRPTLGLGYFTTGAAWSAEYAVTLARDAARVAGHAAITSEGVSADSAEAQLLAGHVGRRPPRPVPMMAQAERAVVALSEAVAGEEGVGEAHLYTLPGRVTLRPRTTSTALLFDPVSAAWERHYVVRGELPWYGPLGQSGDAGETPVEVHYLIRRRSGTAFGDVPLPGGTWRLYEADAGGRPQLVAEASTGHTAAGQDLRLAAGSAFDLTARRVQTEYTSRRDSLRTRVTAGYRVTLANAKDSAVTVDVLEERRGEWRVLESSVPAERLSSTQTRFRIRVPARGEAAVTYRVQVTW